MMNIALSYDEEFVSLIARLRADYGEEIFEIEGIGLKHLDINSNAKDFLSTATTADVSIDANANVDARDVIGYQFELPKPLFRLNSMYLLWEQLCKTHGKDEADALIEMQIAGDIYINDFTDIGRPYCFNFSCYDIVLEGLPMIKKIKSIAPKSLYAFKSQVEQFVVVASNSTLGATGLADLLICIGLYAETIYKTRSDGHIVLGDSEDTIEEYIKETLISLIYTLNQPMRGNQSPFTNVSLYDEVFLKEMCANYALPGCKPVDPYYVNLVQDLYMQAMNDELVRTPITFPVTTACFAIDEHNVIQDKDFRRKIALANMQWGFINIYCGKTSTLSSCCRLRSETGGEYFNTFGAGSTKIGSLGVVTLNLPRIAMLASGHGEASTGIFLANLVDYAWDVCVINNAKRLILQKRIDDGNMPLYTHGHMKLSRQYSTIGITGLYEALYLLCLDITYPNGSAFAVEVLELLGKVCDAATVRFNAPHNMEQVPAETSSIKLSNKDKLLFPAEIELHRPFYSNQFIPLQCGADMLERIRLQGMFDSKCSGGAICHLNVEERITTSSSIEQLIDSCAQSGVVYWAINYNLRQCINGHMTVGKGDVCECGDAVVENYTRVVGFLTNVRNWNVVRRTQDYPERQFY